MKKILFVHMPWVNPLSASLGLSLLKAVLSKNGIQSEISYFSIDWYKMVYDNFVSNQGINANKIIELGTSPTIPAGEWLFSQHFFDHNESKTAEFEKYLTNETGEIGLNFIALGKIVPEFIERCLNKIDGNKYSIIGFSSIFNQQIPSLLLARELKNRWPHLKIMFGGANCHGIMGYTLLNSFKFIDYVFTGEAEESLLLLVKSIEQKTEPINIKGLAWRDGGVCVNNGTEDNNVDLNTLPYPDFSDFFKQHVTLLKKQPAVGSILIETSRGCWWGDKSKCLFCGMHSTDGHHRNKTPSRALAEINYVAARHGVHHFTLADTILNHTYYETLLPDLAKQNIVFDFYCPIKARISRGQAQTLRRAGCSRVVPGIESLSTPVLKIIRKGTTALENVACLKYCREAGIKVSWNIIYGFPGEDPTEYAKMLPFLERITHLAPPKYVGRMHLVRFSPAFNEGEKAGFYNIHIDPLYRLIYPFNDSTLADLCFRFCFDYKMQRDPDEYIRPVKSFVTKWHEQSQKGTLIYEQLENGSALIHDSRFNNIDPKIELSQVENTIYSYCSEIRSLKSILEHTRRSSAKKISQTTVANILNDFYKKHIIIREGDKYLSLAMDNYDLIPWLSATVDSKK